MAGHPVIETLTRGITRARNAIAQLASPGPPRRKSDPSRMRVGTVASGFEVMAGIPEIDYLEQLSFPEYLFEFRKVANHPQVAKELTTNTLPLLAAEWTMEPASDDPEDIDIAEFCAANLLGETGETFGRAYWQKVSWRARLRDVLRFLQNGFSVFQKVYRLEGKFWVYDRIKYLMPESIQEWHFDEQDELTELLRTYTNAQGKMVVREPIAADELVVYTWDQEGANILGKPLIRPMWGPYRMVSQLEKLEVVDKMKTAVGVPFFKHSENPSPEDKADAENLLKSMRSGNLEKVYATIKHDQDFGWKEGGTQTKGIREIVSGKEDQMAKVGGTTASELDNAHSGWSGTAGAKTALESNLRTAVAQVVCEQEQRNVVELVDMNFEGVVEYPQLKVAQIDPFEKTRNIPEFVSALATLSTAGEDLDTENEIRKRYGFMERSAGAPPLGGRRPPTIPAGEGTALRARRRRGRSRVFLSGRRTALASADAVARSKVDHEGMRSRLEGYEAQYLETLKMVLSDMRAAVVEAVGRGLEPKKPADVKVPFIGDLKERLLSILKNVRDFGREQLRSELERQMKASFKSSVTLQSDPNTRAGAIAYANEQAQVLVEVDISQIVQRLQTQVTQEYNRLASQGLSLDQILEGLANTLEATSDQQLERLSRASTSTGLNEGRNITIQEMRDQLSGTVIRTAVMDERTCLKESADDVERCGELDGKNIALDSPDYRKFMPPAFCLGREACRCIYVAFGDLTDRQIETLPRG